MHLASQSQCMESLCGKLCGYPILVLYFTFIKLTNHNAWTPLVGYIMYIQHLCCKERDYTLILVSSMATRWSRYWGCPELLLGIMCPRGWTPSCVVFFIFSFKCHRRCPEVGICAYPCVIYHTRKKYNTSSRQR